MRELVSSKVSDPNSHKYFWNSLICNMNQVFPYANYVAGILIFIVGFIFHWIGQLTSVINWDFATKQGLQEKGLPREYKVYEHALAVADSLLGWIYGITALGLFLNASWGFKLAWFPGVVLLYHTFRPLELGFLQKGA